MTCIKQRVTARLVALDGSVFIGENTCDTPQTVCPRKDMPSGVGYELCKSVCHQENHAEVDAILKAGDKSIGATIYLSGHTYVCDNCKAFADSYGVLKIEVME